MKPETAIATIRLAVDCRTPEGEAQAAFNTLRRAELEWPKLFELIAGPQPVARRTTAPPPPPRYWPPMPFGKYKGRPLDWIAKNAPGYLFWLLDRPDLSPALRHAVEKVLEI